MSYVTRYYTFHGTNAFVDEITHLVIKNDCAITRSKRSGIFKKEHWIEVFGPVDKMDRFEREMENLQLPS